MYKLFLSAASLLFMCFLLALPTEAEGAIYEDTVRLHVLAASDTEADQSVKYEIRDRLLLTYGEELSRCESPEGAVARAEALLPEMEEAVEGWLSELGMPYGAKVTLTEEWYDTRSYQSFQMPKGYYLSLRVILGEGEGQNWWCVMYPPLCLDLATERAEADDAILGYTDEELRLIEGGGYQIKFKLLELFSSLEKNSPKIRKTP